MLKLVAWSFWVFWKQFVESQVVGEAVTVSNGGQSMIVFESHYTVFCMSGIMFASVMSGIMNMGFARSVNSSLASAGKGRITPRSSFMWVLPWGQRTVS